YSGYLGGRANEYRNNDTCFGRFNGAAQRCLIARMYDNRSGRRHDLLCPFDEPFIFCERRMGAWADCHDLTALFGGHVDSSVIFSATYQEAFAWDFFGTSRRCGRVPPASRPNRRATSPILFLSSADNSPRALRTCLMRL